MGINTDKLLMKLEKWANHRDRTEQNSDLIREAITQIKDYRRLVLMYQTQSMRDDK